MPSYQPPSAHTFGTPATPSDIRMHKVVNRYPETAKNKAIRQRQLRENGSPIIAMLNFVLNSHVPEVQFDSTAVPHKFRKRLTIDCSVLEI